MSKTCQSTHLLQLFRDLDPSSAILVGGQSLLLWSLIFDSKGGLGLGIATSDIDIWGTKDTVFAIQSLLQITPHLPGLDDCTPELAVFNVPVLGNKFLRIEVLSAVAGLTRHEMEKNVCTISIGGVNVSVLDPIALIKARLANVVILRRKDDKSLCQLQAAIRIAFYYLDALLHQKGYRYVSKAISEIFSIAQNRFASMVYKDFGVDVLEAIPKQHTAYPSALLDKYFPGEFLKISNRRRSTTSVDQKVEGNNQSNTYLSQQKLIWCSMEEYVSAISGFDVDLVRSDRVILREKNGGKFILEPSS